MLQLARSGEYAIRAVLFLASQPEGKISLVNEISAVQDIPRSYLPKIMQILSKAGLVKSRRGPKGGYSLARTADHITLRETIEAIEGPINLNTCFIRRVKCRSYEVCPVRLVLKEAGEKLKEVLDGTTMAEMIRKGKGSHK